MARLMNIDETANYLGISNTLARKLMTTGEITCLRLHDDRNILLTTQEMIEEFINIKIKEQKKALRTFKEI